MLSHLSEQYRKEAIDQFAKPIQKRSKDVKSDNFGKFGRVITKWGAIEKSSILLSKFWKNKHFDEAPKNHFTNNIFVDFIIFHF